MENLNFRKLNADEIDCRVGSVTDKGVSLLMYKDARVDMRLLDEVVGMMNWKREHQLINGNLFCTVSIRDNTTGEWISKQDVGVESNTEKEKGQASDAFKRACFNWGIGRELYTCPFVWVNLAENEWKTVNGKKQPKTKFCVKDIQYTDDKVSYIVIIDDAGKERFKFGMSDTADKELKSALKEVNACKDVEALKEIYFAHENLKSDSRFVAAVNSRKAALHKAA